MAKNANKTQPIFDVSGDTIAYIDPSLVDHEKLSFNLFGQNTIDISTELNENFIGITQISQSITCSVSFNHILNLSYRK